MFLCFFFGNPRLLPSGLLIFSSARLLWWSLFTPLLKKSPLVFLSFVCPISSCCCIGQFQPWVLLGVPQVYLQTASFGHIGSPCAGFKHVSHPTQVPRQQVLHTSSPLVSFKHASHIQVPGTASSAHRYPPPPPSVSFKHASYPSTCTRASAH